MNIYELMDQYKLWLKQFGLLKAKELLFDSGYNRTITMLIPLLFDDRGNPVKLGKNK